MLLHFPTRDLARNYARTSGNPMIDKGPESLPGKRWACEAVIVPKARIVPRETPKPPAPKPVLNSMKKKIVVIINADKTTADDDIEQCFNIALQRWKASKPETESKISRHTAKAELQALFKT